MNKKNHYKTLYEYIYIYINLFTYILFFIQIKIIKFNK